MSEYLGNAYGIKQDTFGNVNPDNMYIEIETNCFINFCAVDLCGINISF